MVLEGNVCIITGSTSGIGKETALALAREGAILVLPVRNIEKGESLRQEIHALTGNRHVDLMVCDLASLDSVRLFAKNVLEKYKRLDLLINNAGLWETKRSTSVDGIELTFAVNHLAPFLLTHMLTDRLIASAPSRVINLSSEAHRYGKIRFDDLEGKKRWSSFGSYAQSKLANVLFTKELARKLKGTGVTVNALHPGVVSTHLFDRLPGFLIAISRLFMIDPKRGAQTSIYLATSPDAANVTGTYFSKKRAKRTASQANDDDAIQKLWDVSMAYIGGPESIAGSQKSEIRNQESGAPR